MPDSSARLPRFLRSAAASFVGAVIGLTAFAGGWWLLAGSAPTLAGWSLGGVAAAYLGSEVAAHAAARLAGEATDDPQTLPPLILTPSASDTSPTESVWRDRVRERSAPHPGCRR